MEKRYQVFISSTFDDLKDERQEVIQALLELDCIPAGMELFPAANQDQWTLIKKVIEDCDYYLVIVGGRYGSLGPEGISYTEMEYRYALKLGKPILGFLHEAPETLIAKRVEKDPESVPRLEAFRELVKRKPCRTWDSPADLGSKVSRSLVKLIKECPAVGWVRGDMVPAAGMTEELLRLREKVEGLQTELKNARTHAPEGTADLAQGEDTVVLRFGFEAYSYGPGEKFGGRQTITWSDIFSRLSPLLLNEVDDGALSKELGVLVAGRERLLLNQSEKFVGKKFRNFEVRDEDFQTVKVQLRALGLITRSDKVRSVKDAGTYWRLTPYGDATMVQLRALRRHRMTTESDVAAGDSATPLPESQALAPPDQTPTS
jgi:hypothetical protein